MNDHSTQQPAADAPPVASAEVERPGTPGCLPVGLGCLTVLVGIPMLVCPGPGIAVIAGGIGMIGAGLGIRKAR